MTIFSRRVLDRMIRENTSFLTPHQIKKHIDELNAGSRTHKLASEWEVVLLNTFRKVGHVTHERDVAGTLDVYFESFDSSVKFLADITTVSDEGFKELGDFDGLREEITKRVIARGLNPNHFHLHVEGNHGDVQRGRYYQKAGESKLLYGFAVKAKLHAGHSDKWVEDIFNPNWERFLDSVTQSTQNRTYRIFRRGELNVAILFAVSNSSSGSSFAHKQINHVTSNRLFYALRKKANQLTNNPFVGDRGIIVCDGGYTPFHSHPHFGTHTVRDVIQRFLSEYPLVNFVFTVSVKRDSYPRGPNVIVTRPYVVDPSRMNSVIDSIDEAIACVPQAQSDAFNAVNHLKTGRDEGRRNGELTMSSSELRISSRTLMEFLAGRREGDEFISAAFFDRKLEQGMMISEIKVEKSDYDDDDVIVIDWSGPDPAISPFGWR